MSEKPPAADPTTADATIAELDAFALEEREDSRVLKRALVVALAVHLGVLPLTLPGLGGETLPEPPRDKIFVLETYRFEEPKVDTPKEVPERQPIRKPMPDPTPDDPEPIREPEIEEPEFDLVDDGLVFHVPAEPPPPEPSGPMILQGDMEPPVRTHDPAPRYTEAARRAGIQGVVILQSIIEKDGTVSNVKVLKGLGWGLDESAATAIKQWRFEPAKLDGRPVTVYYNLTVNFNISR